MALNPGDGSQGYAYLDVPRRDMVGFVPVATRSMLDVGCGRGGFGRSVKERSTLEVTGIEMDPVAAEVAASRYDHVINGTFPDDLPEGAVYDCIVFNDILEHLVDPWSALRAASGILAPGGVVVASIPNMRYWPVFWALLTRGEWRYVSDGVLDRAHLRFFTGRSAEEMFTDSGFRIVRMTPINPVGFGELPRRSAQVLKIVCRFREPLGHELRAQQFAIVAAPRVVSEH
jgi:2-polyprenyl-3-methyl-5-hydroxy-6-metoxy-1,4-benzoquinol methylase